MKVSSEKKDEKKRTGKMGKNRRKKRGNKARGKKAQRPGRQDGATLTAGGKVTLQDEEGSTKTNPHYQKKNTE